MLVVNDGANATGSPCPNSYVSTDEMRAYWADRADSLFTGSPTIADGVIDAALLFAADYLQQRYRMRWIGSKVNARQCMDWPRRWAPIRDFDQDFPQAGQIRPPGYSLQNTYDVYFETTEIPEPLKTAQILLARAAITDDALSASQLVGALDRATKREKLQGLEVEYFNATQEKLYLDASRELEVLLKPQRGTWERG